MDSETLAFVSHKSHVTQLASHYLLTVAFHPASEVIGASCLIEPGNGITELSRLSPEFKLPSSHLTVTLGDPYISRKPAQIMRSANGVIVKPHPQGAELCVGDRKITQPEAFSAEQLAEGIVLVLAQRVILVLHSESLLAEDAQGLGMVGISSGIEQARQALQRVADLPVPVLIRGETGTGKELIARALHGLSPRAANRMVAVNVAAIAESLVVAELFGAKKGAYTGANRDKPGLFEQAHGSTLFLDEIGDAADDVQVALLRAIESGEVQPVGASEPIRVDVRLVAATDADLEAKLAGQGFRQPLLQRLAGYEIRLPPLRQRRVDIALLLNQFLQQEASALGYSLADFGHDPQQVAFWGRCFLRCLGFAWPGNIRQLSNTACQLVIHNRDRAQPELPGHLREMLVPAPVESGEAAVVEACADGSSAADVSAERPPVSRRRPADVSEQEMMAALQASQYDIKHAAEQLGLSRASLYNLIDASDRLRKASDISADELLEAFNHCSGQIDRMVELLQVSRSALQRRLKEVGVV